MLFLHQVHPGDKMPFPVSHTQNGVVGPCSSLFSSSGGSETLSVFVMSACQHVSILEQSAIYYWSAMVSQHGSAKKPVQLPFHSV